MNEFLKYFLSAFVVFVVVGVIAGWSDRKDIAAEKLYPFTEVVKVNDNYFLKIESEDYRYLYSVDDNSISDFDEDLAITARYEQNSLTKTSAQHNQIVETVGQFLGPTAGVSVSLYQVVNATKKPGFWSAQSFKKNVTLVIGSITGYLVGKWAGSNYKTSPDSDLAIELMSKDMDMWKRAEHLRLKATLMEIQTTSDAHMFGYNNVGILGNDPIIMCNCEFSTKVKDELQLLIKQKIDLTSADFQMVDNYYGKFLKAKTSQAYRALQQMTPAKIASDKTGAKTTKAISKKLGYTEQAWNSNCSLLCSHLD